MRQAVGIFLGFICFGLLIYWLGADAVASGLAWLIEIFLVLVFAGAIIRLATGGR